MLVLGIADGQTGGACVVRDGVILAAVNEERVVRLKQARGFPWESITEVLRISGVSASDIEGVAIAEINMKLREKVDGWPGWFEARAESKDGIKDVLFRAASRFGGLIPYVPGLKALYYGLRKPQFQHRRRRIAEIMKDEFHLPVEPKYYHHHFAHATSAYYTSNYKNALTVTMDGGGDGHCAHVYSVRSGVFARLTTCDSYNSLGNYYAYVTAICGYKAKRHEGKITGLAARGKPIYREFLRSLMTCRDGQLVNRGRVLFNRALDRIRSGLPAGWKHEDLAASIQVVAEEVATEFVGYWVRKTGHRNVALAGGLFANVRINEEILRTSGVDNVFVHPGMSDDGLFVGAALAMDYEDAQAHGREYQPSQLPDVYLGTDLSEQDCEAALNQAGLEYTKPDNVAEFVAERLAEGKVVARTAGRMEYGPRALGNRTIMYRPDDPSVNDWLNELLQRTEFMPFAPASKYETADELYVDTAGALDTARFMTITLHCTDDMRKRCPGVVHCDGTARPQLVRREDNPEYYDIIDAYTRRTGLPAVINTSFNIHEEPIVRTADDAVRAFITSKLDFLQLGPFVATGPVGSDAVRAKWAGRESVWGQAAMAAV